MSPLPALSNEIWQTILRHTIHVPDFLDPDSFEGDLRAYGFGSVVVDDQHEYDDDARRDEEGYWDVERVRGTLECVCKGWYEYLHRFEHRFVDMSDVQSGLLDKRCLKKAIRISMGQALDTFAQFCCDTFEHFDSLPTQILDINVALPPQLWKSGALHCFNQAQVILCPTFYGDLGRPLLSPTTTPALKHIHGQIYDDLQHLHFTSPTLLTVDFRLEKRHTYKSFILDLPSLQHLRIDFTLTHDAVPKLHEKILGPVLHSVGTTLRSLYIVTRDPRSKFPEEVWEWCPKLEKFHPGMMLPATPPPTSHPIHTLAVPLEVPLEYLSRGMIAQWSNLRKVIVQQSWSAMTALQIADITAFWREGWKERGGVLEDVHGNALEEFIGRRVLR